MPWLLRSCVHCGGDLFHERELINGRYVEAWKCIQCSREVRDAGNQMEEKPPESRYVRTAERKRLFKVIRCEDFQREDAGA